MTRKDTTSKSGSRGTSRGGHPLKPRRRAAGNALGNGNSHLVGCDSDQYDNAIKNDYNEVLQREYQRRRKYFGEINSSDNNSSNEEEGQRSDASQDGDSASSLQSHHQQQSHQRNVTLGFWDFGQCDSKKCSGRKLYRLGKVKLFRTNQKFHGIILR